MPPCTGLHPLATAAPRPIAHRSRHTRSRRCALVLLVAGACRPLASGTPNPARPADPGAAGPSDRAGVVDLMPAHATLVLPGLSNECEYKAHAPIRDITRVTPHRDHTGVDPRPRWRHVTLVDDAATTVIVQWTTGADTLWSRVSLASPHGAIRTVDGYSFPLPGAPGLRQHEVQVCGLDPDVTYRWHVDGPAPSPDAELHAPGGGHGPLRILVVGDARSDPAAWHVVTETARREHPDVLLFTGDAVVDGGSAHAWQAFFDAGDALLASTPGIWADGNHEGVSALYYALFALPPNGSREYHERWYAIDVGPVRVIVLNDTTATDAQVRGVEHDFLASALHTVDRAKTPWVITAHHQPMYTDSIGHLPDLVSRTSWGPIFDDMHVDADFSGHVHNYESTQPIRANAVTDAAHGTQYVIFGGAGAPLYGFLQQAPWVRTRERTHGFGILEAGPHTLTWEARRSDGTVIEQIDLAPSR